MEEDGKVSLFGFSIGLSLILIVTVMGWCGVGFDHDGMEPRTGALILAGVFGLFMLLFVLLLAKASLSTEAQENPSQVVGILSRSCFLGWAFSVGMILVKTNYWWESPFGLYICFLTAFHYSEYLVTSIISPATLSLDSFLLNHSKEYGIAALASWVEYGVEAYYLPNLKFVRATTILGFILCVTGELLRKGAMLKARENFTHIVRDRKVEGHQLVTTGLYSICRHPSYAGWFGWSVGTQILLFNPICIVGYTLASWKFFNHRIYFEEASLLNFFGQKYSDYQKRVSRTGVPFVSGFKISD